VITVSTDDNLFDALEVISKKDFSVLPVVSSNNPSKLMGILTRRDIVSTYDKVIIKRSVFG
jgi:CIC family chloride channel protein